MLILQDIKTVENYRSSLNIRVNVFYVYDLDSVENQIFGKEMLFYMNKIERERERVREIEGREEILMMAV